MALQNRRDFNGGMVLALLATLLTRFAPDIGNLENQDYKLDGGYTVSIVPDAKEGELKPLIGSHCWNVCKGEKHFLHKQCDTSCDKACREDHRYTFKPLINYGQVASTHELKDAVDKITKGPHETITNPTLKATLDKLVSDATGKHPKEKEVKVTWQHWAKEPCAMTSRQLMCWVYPVDVHWQITQEVKGADGKSEVKEIAKGKMTVDLAFPTDQFKDLAPYVNCSARSWSRQVCGPRRR